MAQQLLRSFLEKEGVNGVEVGSAGTAAYPHYNIIGDLKEVMDNEGINYEGHTPKMIDRDILETSDVVLAATRAHVEEIESRLNPPTGKVQLLSAYAAGEVWDIEDPIGRGKSAYERVFVQIKKYIEKITERLKNEN